MGKWGNLIYCFARDDSGQAITEYILLLSFAVGAAGLLARGLIAVLDRITLTFGAQLEKDLKTGRANVGTWSN